MACPGQGYLDACAFTQALVDETPKFDEEIIMDIRPSDGWLLNVATATAEMGTPTEVTQDRFRSVWPNTTKVWTRVVANGTGCTGNPCDPPEHAIGYGADRLTWFAEQQSWATPLFCYDQMMHITKAMEHIDQVISEILRPATIAISSNFLRKRALYWAGKKWIATSPFTQFTYQWTLAGPNLDEEQYFDCNASPAMFYKLMPQMLQHRFDPLMRRGYAGKNPFAETSPFIELVLDMDTTWNLSRLGDQGGVGVADSPNVLGNWRFTEFSAADKYWRYGFGFELGNFMVRVDPMGLRFNYVGDQGPSANGGNGNRYRYQIVLPYVNSVTTGAGGSAGIGDDSNPAFDNAQYRIGHIHHKKGMELLVPDAKPINPDMPFGHRDFGGKWQFVMHDLGADQNGVVINNKRKNKGQFIADFQYWVRPMHYEFMEAIFYKAEQMIVPLINPATPDPGYPTQIYDSELPPCPQTGWPAPLYAGGVPPGGGVPTGTQDGPVPQPPVAIPQGASDY